MNLSRNFGLAALIIGVLSILLFLPAAVVGAIVALVGLFKAKDAAGHRRVDWLCLAALLLNGVALAIGLPFFLMASGR
jgi:uncharacterized membrane protein